MVSVAGNIIREYLDYSDPRIYDLLEGWVMGSHGVIEKKKGVLSKFSKGSALMLYDQFTAFPYILLEQKGGTGKSQTMGVCEHLCLRGKSGSFMTAPTIRDFADDGFTLFLDDFPRIDADTASILKKGYQKGATMSKKIWDKSAKSYVTQDYTIYVPKMIATNKPLDPIILQRMLPIQTYTTSRKMPQIDPKDTVWEKGRNDLAQNVYDHWDSILKEYASFNAVVSNGSKSLTLIARELELWKPLISIGRGTGLPIEGLAVDIILAKRSTLAYYDPDYMLLQWIEGEIANGTMKDWYLSLEIEQGVMSVLAQDQLPYWSSTQPGLIFNRLLPYPVGYPKIKSGSGKGRLYHFDPAIVRQARNSHPL